MLNQHVGIQLHTTHSLSFQLRFHSPSALTPAKFLIHILIFVLNTIYIDFYLCLYLASEYQYL